MFKLLTISCCKNIAFFLLKKYLRVYFIGKSSFLQYLCPVHVIKPNWIGIETIIYNYTSLLLCHGCYGSKREGEKSALC